MANKSGRLAFVLVLLVVIVQGIMLLAFAWPAVNTAPRELPIALAGPPEATAEIEQGLAAVPGGELLNGEEVVAFDVIAVADEEAAEQAIWDREAYGAIVVTPEGPRLLVASGAGPAVAQLLRTGISELAGAQGGEDAPPPEVEDIVPGHEGDPNGAGLAAGVLPLVMTSAGAGLAIGIMLSGVWPRILAILGLAVAGGALSCWLLIEPLDALPGPYLGLGGTLGLVIGAVSAGVAGLGALLGRFGAILGMLTMLFVGNPLSAATTAPQLLPYGEYGQYLPPGAGVSLVRSISFFDGVAATEPLLVLCAWIGGGLLLTVVGGLLRRGRKDDAEDGVEDGAGDDTPEPSEPTPAAAEVTPYTPATSSAASTSSTSRTSDSATDSDSSEPWR